MYKKEVLSKLLKNYSKIIVFLIAFLLTTLIYFNFSYLFDKKELKIFFLNVGQGDSELIISPRGSINLIDAGPSKNIVGLLENTVSQVTDRIDSVLLTHQDLDHMGGFEYLNKAFHVKSLYVSNNYTEKLDFLSINRVSQGDILDIGDSKIEIISPKTGDFGSTNHTSTVSLVKYGNFRFIFMADADKETERKLVSKGYFVDSDKYIDILKLGHHGSDTSSSEALLKLIKPEYCIFSVGKNNIYHLPSENVVFLAKKYCKSIYRTDEDGTLGFFTDGKVLKIKKSL